MDPMTEAENALRTPLPAEERREIPALLRSAYWPQALWPLHDLFERFEEVTPFPGEEDTVYIRVPLGDAYEEIDHYLVGAKVGEGWVVGVGYLLPGAWQRRRRPAWRATSGRTDTGNPGNMWTLNRSAQRSERAKRFAKGPRRSAPGPLGVCERNALFLVN